jgi:hypothetical protein
LLWGWRLVLRLGRILWLLRLVLRRGSLRIDAEAIRRGLRWLGGWRGCGVIANRLPGIGVEAPSRLIRGVVAAIIHEDSLLYPSERLVCANYRAQSVWGGHEKYPRLSIRIIAYSVA